MSLHKKDFLIHYPLYLKYGSWFELIRHAAESQIFIVAIPIASLNLAYYNNSVQFCLCLCLL